MMESLEDSLERQYTKDDLFKLKTIDDSIIAFITYVRKTQLWFDKKLEGSFYAHETNFMLAELRQLLRNNACQGLERAVGQLR